MTKRVWKALQKMGESATSSDLDTAVSESINGNGRAVVLSNTIVSPSTRKAIESLGAEHIQYDAISYSALREAQARIFWCKCSSTL